MKSYDSFTRAYVDLCRLIRDEHEFESAPRGMKIKESLGVQFRIKNPRDRLPLVAARNFSAAYFVAETLWYLSGSDSTAWISRYASFWKNITDDGVTANSAYGARIFRPHDRIANRGIVQWDYVKEELRKDPDSRRAVIHIRTPDDSLHAVKDVPCTLALQFFIREGKLHLHVNMRSSDIILGIAYDVPAFTTMQEIMANELGVGLGEYVHTSNSLHCYERDFEMLDAIANDDDAKGCQMAPLPEVFPTEKLLAYEQMVQGLTESELRDGVHEMGREEQLVRDWTLVLGSFRARKLKDDRLAKIQLLSTTDRVYHFYNR
jgi:thymidylate synthase